MNNKKILKELQIILDGIECDNYTAENIINLMNKIKQSNK